MTPLAQKIVRDMLLPRRKRQFDDAGKVLDLMSDVHCFEVSEVLECARDLMPFSDSSQATIRNFESAVRDTTFLSAPRTWIEYQLPIGGRIGFLLVESGLGRADLRTAVDVKAGFKSFPTSISFDLSQGDGSQLRARLPVEIAGDEKLKNYSIVQLQEIAALLALINTPRIIGRRQHMPHAGLERELLRQREAIGKFPLNAYTEIKLHVMRPPEDLSDDPVTEAHLTGAKALHFCRAHMRWRLGRVEIVRGHWRGDPSLGTKRSRYTVLD